MSVVFNGALFEYEIRGFLFSYDFDNTSSFFIL